MRVYIGIDVGKSSVAALCFSGKQKAERQIHKFEHTSVGFHGLVDWAKSRGGTDPVFVMEASGCYWAALYSWLSGGGLAVVLIRPSSSRFFAKARNKRTKNDRVDARTIAEYAASESLESESSRLENYETREAARFLCVQVEKAAVTKTRLIQTLDVVFPELRRSLKNPTNKTSLAILRKYPTPRQIRSAGLDKIKEIKVGTRRISQRVAAEIFEWSKDSVGMAEAGDFHAVKIRALIDDLDSEQERIARISKWIDENIDANAVRILESYPGCSTATASVLVSEIRDPARFRNADKIVAYAGVNPREFSSGKGTRQGKSYRMSKQGNRRIRSAIYMIALSAIRCEPVVREYYQKKRKEGKKPKVAIGHCMRKILVTLWAMWKREASYDAKLGVPKR